MVGDVDRRTLLKLLAACLPAAGLSATPAVAAAARDELGRALGLRADEVAWLHELSAHDQRQLLAALTAPGDAVAPETLRLIDRLLGRRSRAFAYVGYPPVADVRSVCDGLIRE